MDTWGLLIMGTSVVGYFVSKKNATFLFTLGIGVGLFVVAIWGYFIVARILS